MGITIKKIDAKNPESFPPLWKRLAFPLIGLSIMVAILCYILYFSVEKEDPQTIPLIRAEPGPYRIKPEDPGGRSIPHQDKLVYERLSSQEIPEYEAQFVPNVEEPIDIQQLGKEKGIADLAQEVAQDFPLNPQETSNIPSSSSVKTPSMKEENPVKVQPSKTPVLPTPVSPTPAVSAQALITATPKKPGPVAVVKSMPSPSTPSSSKIYRVQLASSRSTDILVKEWKRLQVLHPDLFKGYKPIYLRLKEDTGIYYALRVGNFTNAVTAKKYYQKLQQKKINCKIIETL